MYREGGGSGDPSGEPLPWITVAAFSFVSSTYGRYFFELHSHSIAGIVRRQLKEESNND
ncbi:hypothetical protein [Burkholderia cenocepacia]|uniref:hypothetical protein n=1 Tax=Burkholderia cenocepacia TaxID=95486 RepID=UPI000A9209B8|nr:hypothetical protein [Burkholderia cenocepacia]